MDLPNTFPQYSFTYLGHSQLANTATGLGSAQKALTQLYLGFLLKPNSSTPTAHYAYSSSTIQFDALDTGISIRYWNPNIAQFTTDVYPYNCVTFVDALQFEIHKGKVGFGGSRKKSTFGIFRRFADDDPSTESITGLVSIDRKHHQFLAEQVFHRPIVMCILRRPSGIKFIDCHVFLGDLKSVVLQFVQTLRQCAREAQILEALGHSGGVEYSTYRSTATNNSNESDNSVVSRIWKSQPNLPTSHWRAALYDSGLTSSRHNLVTSSASKTSINSQPQPPKLHPASVMCQRREQPTPTESISSFDASILRSRSMACINKNKQNQHICFSMGAASQTSQQSIFTSAHHSQAIPSGNSSETSGSTLSVNSLIKRFEVVEANRSHSLSKPGRLANSLFEKMSNASHFLMPHPTGSPSSDLCHRNSTQSLSAGSVVSPRRVKQKNKEKRSKCDSSAHQTHTLCSPNDNGSRNEQYCISQINGAY